MKTRIVILDFDGTLCDTRRNIVLTLRMTMARLGLSDCGEASCAATIGLTLKDAFIRLHPELSSEQADHCTEVYRVLFDENKKKLVPQMFPHVMQTLEQLHERGITLTVASSRSHESLDVFVEELGLDKYTGYVLGAEDTVHSKPDPEPVLKTLSELGFSAGESLVVGDMPYDILMGRNAGARTCGVSYGNSCREELLASGADFVIDDFAELAALVK